MATTPVNGARLEALVTQADRKLDRLEGEALKVIDGGLRRAAVQLEQELARLYRQALQEVDGVSRGSALREARARLLLERVRELLEITVPDAPSALTTLLTEAHQAGREEAFTLLTQYDRDLVRSFAVVPEETIAAATNAATRLAAHGQDFARRAAEHVISGITTGRSWSATARDLRRETGITRARAETIIRTESVTASSLARQKAFEESGVTEYVWLATNDAQVCSWCASRAGTVWRVGDGPLPPAHPRCRCSTAPERPRWRELGLVDTDFRARHARETMARAGIERRTLGPSPAEQKLGITFGRPVVIP
jgi:SPP1 gp7 family putative phage head morphogenesis protein